jgi:pyruvate-ferredoxin/flavodoxin oxidoreductase
MGNPSHLFNGILEGMESPEPSLFSIFAPEHKKHFIVNDAWPKLAGLALNSRAFPSLRFNPKEESKFLSSAIHLGANPDANENWYSETLTYSEGEEEHSFNYAITWADWAYTIREWKSHFSDYKKENGAALPVSDYIALDEDARNGNVPVIIRAKEGNLERYAISKQAVTACEVMLTAWNTWRELAGTLSEFPEKLKKKVTAELSLKFGADLEKAKDDFENRLKDQERTQVEAIRQKLKEKLVALAKQGEN